MRFTLSLVLKVRTFGTQKWPITRQSKTCLCSRATTSKPVVAQTHENCLSLLHRDELKHKTKQKANEQLKSFGLKVVQLPTKRTKYQKELT